MRKKDIIPIETVENKIFFIRGQKIMIDRDLAELYGVTTKRLNEQVKRNKKRFPGDFMFQLTTQEKLELVANCDRFNPLKHSTSLPFVFTEHGAVMLASVLNSPRAVETSILVVRAFIRLREILATHKELAQKLKDIELKIETHDEKITAILLQRSPFGRSNKPIISSAGKTKKKNRIYSNVAQTILSVPAMNL